MKYTPLTYSIKCVEERNEFCMVLCIVNLKLKKMNRKKAQQILKAYGRPMFKVGNPKLSFVRQTDEDLTEIESKTDEELIEEWKSLVWMNRIYGQVSVDEIQRISLIELEMDGRKIESAPLKSWYEIESANFEEPDFNGA